MTYNVEVDGWAYDSMINNHWDGLDIILFAIGWGGVFVVIFLHESVMCSCDFN
jgi:hypothetical protein